jgi:hypothetical protein
LITPAREPAELDDAAGAGNGDDEYAADRREQQRDTERQAGPRTQEGNADTLAILQHEDQQ